MTIEVIDICCNQCDSVASTSTNEWTRGGASLIAPFEATRYKTTTIENEQAFVPIVTQTERLIGDVVCDQRCGKCGNVLGQELVDTSCADQLLTDRYGADDVVLRHG